MKSDPRFPNPFVLDHPLVQHKPTHMRDRATSTRGFRDLLRELTLLMCYGSTRDLPLATIQAPVAAGDEPVVLPILRAAGDRQFGTMG